MLHQIEKDIVSLRVKLAYMTGAATVGACIGAFLAVIVLKYFQVS